LSICLGPQGKVQQAIKLTQRGLEISEEIGHDQWLIGAHFDLGALYLEIFGLSQSRQHFELALTLARETGSSLWIGTVTGYLASTCILQGDLSRAEDVLGAELNVNTPAQTQMQRLCWCARAELALARIEPQLALSIIDRLIDSEPNTKSTASIPRLSKLRSDALVELGHPEEAASELRLAQATTLKQDSLSLSWRIDLALGKLYQNQKRNPEANAEFSRAQKIIEQLLASFQDQTLSGIFETHTATVLPVPAAASAPRMERERFGGLTTREREVAAWIAQGLSNREIAKKLVISERTVESHVTNILAKLDFSSRSRIAAWATEKGLGKPVE
jgi:DNA-binding CsgD family transcriptional regulator